MKEILKNKRFLAVVAVVLVAVLSIVIAVSVKGNKVETAPENSQPNTSDVSDSETSTEENTTKGEEETTKDAEKVTESTTKKAPETTTSNNKPSTTKKPAANKKPSSGKTPSTTKKAEAAQEGNFPANEDDFIEQDRYLLYQQYGGEAGYKAHLEEIKNAKCQYCGQRDCPSLNREKNVLGDADTIRHEYWRCPEVAAERAKCKHCGKIIVSGPGDVEKVESHPEKYCYGNCYISF